MKVFWMHLYFKPLEMGGDDYLAESCQDLKH